MRRLEDQCPLRKGLIEFLQPPGKLGFLLVLVMVIVQWGTGRIFELRVNVPAFALQSLRESYMGQWAAMGRRRQYVECS
jgi:hypothetical protein